MSLIAWKNHFLYTVDLKIKEDEPGGKTSSSLIEKRSILLVYYCHFYTALHKNNLYNFYPNKQY